MSKFISAKNKKNRNDTHTFFQLWLSQKFDFVFFSFFTLKDLSTMISYLYFGYLDQKLYWKKKIMSNFWHKTCFFQKSVFWQKNFFFGKIACGFRKVQNTIYIFWAKSGGQILKMSNFCSIFSSCHHSHFRPFSTFL
jgi:hypothetical protein